jgi:tellurite resistance-related uncharacterized protein
MMERLITSFGLDSLGDYYAKLDCGHRQHVRHNPPLSNREWVLTENGRQGKIGHPLNCILCVQLEMPEGFVCFQKTPVFTEETLPAGLQKDHQTGTGVWAKIIVEKGTLHYHAAALGIDMALTSAQTGIIVPNVIHAVTPVGKVRFYVEFYRSESQ